jgi:hypothetical protein
VLISIYVILPLSIMGGRCYQNEFQLPTRAGLCFIVSCGSLHYFFEKGPIQWREIPLDRSLSWAEPRILQLCFTRTKEKKSVEILSSNKRFWPVFSKYIPLFWGTTRGSYFFLMTLTPRRGWYNIIGWLKTESKPFSRFLFFWKSCSYSSQSCLLIVSLINASISSLIFG